MVDVKIQRPENVMWLQRAHKARVSGSMVELNCRTLIFLSIDVWWSGQVVEVKIPRPKDVMQLQIASTEITYRKYQWFDS